MKYLVPQVFGWASDVCVEVRHVDKLCDASLSGCLGNLLRDGHKDVVETIVAEDEKERKIAPFLSLMIPNAVWWYCEDLCYKQDNKRPFCCLYLVSHSLPTRLMTTFECSKARFMESLSLASHSCIKKGQRQFACIFLYSIETTIRKASYHKKNLS